jgi:hypothetical protein
VTRLVRIAMERIEHDGVGAEQMQLCEVIDDLVATRRERTQPGCGCSASVHSCRSWRPACPVTDRHTRGGPRGPGADPAGPGRTPRARGGPACLGGARGPGDGPGPDDLAPWGNAFQERPPAGYGGAVVWPADPGSLLTGARGRRMCWSLVESVGKPARPPIGPGWEQVQLGSPGAESVELAAELGTAVARADLDAVAAMSDVALLAAVADSVDTAMYWQPPDAVDQALAHADVAAALRPVAEAVTGAPGARWWSGGVELDTQRYVEPIGESRLVLSGTAGRLAAWLAAEAEDERSAALRPADPAAPYSGHWWSSPKWSGVASTTRALPDLGAVQLAAMEDSPGQDEMRCWPVKPRQVPRIYEIAEPDHWIALAARYPLDVSKSRRHDWWKITGWPGPWLMPDYAAAAADYDAIHLTVGGYLTTAGEALPVNDARCLLAAWDPDETYWLTDILAPAGPPARWVRDGSTQIDWRLAPF